MKDEAEIEVHHCHARNCKVSIPPRLLMCPKHWRMVPRRIQNNVNRNYRRGQEIDKNPTMEYMGAAKDAIDSVAWQEDVDGY